tara:strand:+ start:15 stop:437 length:423 start_codon:yes stop_codon:yes gene_type:complete
MQVLFRHNAFIGGTRWRRAQSRHDWVDFPDELEDQLPSSARIKVDGKLVTMEDIRGDRANTLAGMRESSSKNMTMAEAMEEEQKRNKELEDAFDEDDEAPEDEDDDDDEDEEEEALVVAKPAKKAGKKKAPKKKAVKKKK